MTQIDFKASQRSQDIGVELIRGTDGKRVKIGRVSYAHKNPILHALGQIPVWWNRLKLKRWNADALRRIQEQEAQQKEISR
jgi:hypothetical protein